MTMKQTITLHNDLSQVQVAKDALNSFAQRCQLPSKVLHDVTLALEEVLVNAVTHGCLADRRHHIQVELAYANHSVSIRVMDDGKPYNPLEAPEPDLNLPLAERPIGGLGVFLVRKLLMDDVDYQYQDGRNILEMSKRVGHATSEDE